MDQRCFAILCHLLRTIAGLMSMEVVDVEEMVAMFLHILAHDVKNRVIQREFIRSFNEMVAMYLACVTRKEISFTYLPVGKDQLWTHASSAITNWLMPGTQMQRVSWHHTEASATTCKNDVGKSYYPVEVQCRTILACCLLHNLINREMTNFDIKDNIDEVDSTHVTTTADDIHYIETSNEWSQWRDDLAEEMFTDWELCNQ
ncbi:putative nuclease HARBI1 [Cucumis melo var. makuwa]|uniref:Nuclease HARBI1 n=1 Tax=Cucumis melo var. makuwa TaxID=1194695 RepID=A0A5A7TC28_CUCMM|nr:putative nuclease HARBI1 [Cucumis melo var. makuwa]TYK20381.1 putative nuclease HARBI1 [Cucumis melo var. makuwa]